MKKDFEIGFSQKNREKSGDCFYIIFVRFQTFVRSQMSEKSFLALRKSTKFCNGFAFYEMGSPEL